MSMLRSTLLSFSHAFPPKFKPTPSSTSSTTTTPTASSSFRCPPPVRQNSPLAPPTSAYLHLPFCRKRCHYCDFPIIALGSSSSSSSSSSSNDNDPRFSDYIHLLLREIHTTNPQPQLPLQTIFFGGGTPSLVPPHLISQLLHALQSQLGVSPSAEVSIEMDPGTFDASKLEELVRIGVNRVSLGVQAFQDEILKACGRAHGVNEVEEAMRIVAECQGLENWSMDLISSLPHQTAAMWSETLRRTVEAQPMHVSVYDLQVEQGTKFGQLYTPGEFPLPSDTESANFYKMASETLCSAGYNHYEISSYCKPGYECKHNLAYWQNIPFYGFGLGAASYVDGVRFSRPRRLKEYTDYVHKLENGLMTHENVVLEATEMAMDVVMLSLRTARGLDVKAFGMDFGWSLVLALFEAFVPYAESGHVIAMDGERRALSHTEFELQVKGDCFEEEKKVAFIRLSDPEGFLMSNELIAVAFRVISP